MVTSPGPGVGSSRSANRTTSGPPGSMISIALTRFSNPIRFTGDRSSWSRHEMAGDGGRSDNGRRHNGQPRAPRLPAEGEPADVVLCGREVEVVQADVRRIASRAGHEH